jgi:predicted permease
MLSGAGGTVNDRRCNLLSMLRDLAHVVRQAARRPAFAGIVVLVLALGLGANAALWSVADAVLFRPLPVSQPDRLVIFRWTGPADGIAYLTGEWTQDAASGRVTTSSFSYPAFEAFGRPAAGLSDVFAWSELRRASLTADGASVLVHGQVVSGNFHAGLGVRAALGRTLGLDDDREGAPLAVVLGDAFWRRRFGGDPSVVGRTIALDGRVSRIVGVTGPGFAGTLPLGETADVTLALRAWRAGDVKALTHPGWNWLTVMGRLAPGAAPAQAREEMAARFAAPRRLALEDGRRGSSERRDAERPVLALLAAVTGLVLLLSAATVSALLLARGEARRTEVAVRLALGAGRARIVRELLAEAALLAGTGLAAGVALAAWTKDALAAGLLPDGAPPVALDARVVALLVAAALASALVSGLWPALRATRTTLDLRRDSERAGARLRVGRLLVVAQVALSVVLLVGAGLLLRSLRNLTAAGPEAPDAIAFKVHAPPAAATAELSRRLLERLAAVPGVRAASASAHHPLDGLTDRTRVAIAGRPVPPGVSAHAHVQRVAGEYFRVNGLAIRAGRALAASDDAGSAPVLVVNEAFARAYFPDGGALGAVVNDATVVGVAPDARTLRGPAPPAMLVPAWQGGLAVFAFQLDAPGTTPAALEAAVRDVAPDAAVYERTTTRAQWAAAAQQERFLASLTTAFAAVALLQAALGLYGSLAQATARRTREIGIRMALGARPASVRRATVASGLRLAAAGALLGLAGSAALAPVAHSVLYGVTPSDPWTAASAVGVLAAAAVAACWLPAARASRVDPAVALRHD